MPLIRRLFLAIIVIRSALDVVFGALRLDGSGFSPGAVLNAVIIAAGMFVVMRKGIRALHAPLLIWLAYLAYAALTLSRSPDAGEGFRLFLGLLSTYMVFTIAFNTSTLASHAEALLKCIIYSSFAVALFGIFQYVFIDRLAGRLSATFEHPNILAFYLLLVITTLFYERRFQRLNRLPRILPGRLPYVGLLLVLLLLTETRSAWIATAAAFAIYAALANRKLLVTLALVPALLLVPAISDRFSDLGSSGTAQDVHRGVQIDSYSWRQLLWQYALVDSEDSRTTGKGLGSFRSNSRFFFPLEESADAHSAYIQTIYETGMVGLGLYVAVFLAFAVAIHRSRTDKKTAAMAVALIAAYLLESYSDNTLYYLSYNWYFWAFIGCHLGSTLGARRRIEAGVAAPAEAHAVVLR
ncbi:O-antigen ligase family protein [Burkholderia sp. NLJ2]|uniref:O-antigen ligase family protein n=1 Tax=Burkholderia sp. NLJ2 TaxID=3090699 RepID=UPI003C6BE6EB